MSKQIEGTNYMQIVPMSDEEKLKMYMKSPKAELAKMLVNCNNLLDQMRPIVNVGVAAYNKMEKFAEDEIERASLLPLLAADRKVVAAMREIKFRAWDETTKTMIDLRKITPLALSIDQDGIFIPFNGMPLMQFTGLKDKNSKEIYEGDVIRCSATQREINDVLEDAVVRVEYSNGYFYPFGYNAGWRSEVFDIVVLGNIHENPELLQPRIRNEQIAR